MRTLIVVILFAFLGLVKGQVVTTLLGTKSSSGSADGVGTSTLFNYPNGIAVDQTARLAYIVDSDNQNIRVADLTSLAVTTLVGSSTTPTPGSSDGMGSACQFNNPNGIAIDTTRGILFVADMNNHLIRSVAITPRVCETLGGGGGITPPQPGTSDGVGTNSLFHNPSALAVDTGAGVLYVADANNNKVRVLSLSTFTVTTLVGGGLDGQTPGYADGFGTLALFTQPFGIGICAPGLLCLADSSNSLIRTITLATAQVNTLAGQPGDGGKGVSDGVGTLATFTIPFGILPWQGTDILITDNYAVRKINLATHTVSTIAGSNDQGSSDGMGTSASFYTPQGITMYTPAGGAPVALVVDAGIFVVRVLSLNASSFV